MSDTPIFMRPARYALLMRQDGTELTQEEKQSGWHFCLAWDGLLIGPGMRELEPCHCLPEDHAAYDLRKIQ